MKKPALILLIAVAGLSSCSKNSTPVHEAHSQVMDIKPSDWTTQDDGLSYSYTIDVPALTNTVFDHGAVIVYLSFVDNIYEAVPEEFDGISYGAIHSTGAVTVDMHAIDQGKINPPSGDIYAKVVLINAQQLALHPNINLHDYGEVQKTFHIK
jgi:hypothetical protein